MASFDFLGVKDSVGVDLRSHPFFHFSFFKRALKIYPATFRLQFSCAPPRVSLNSREEGRLLCQCSHHLALSKFSSAIGIYLRFVVVSEEGAFVIADSLIASCTYVWVCLHFHPGRMSFEYLDLSGSTSICMAARWLQILAVSNQWARYLLNYLYAVSDDAYDDDEEVRVPYSTAGVQRSFELT